MVNHCPKYEIEKVRCYKKYILDQIPRSLVKQHTVVDKAVNKLLFVTDSANSLQTIIYIFSRKIKIS